MKNVMTMAWEIARKGAAQFGGKVKEYFAEALKMAWAEVKSVTTTVKVMCGEGTRNSKTWVAEIVGTHTRFGLDRKFINGEEDDNVRGLFFTLEEGKVYDVNNYMRTRTLQRPDCSTFETYDLVRTFITISKGQVVELAEAEAKAMIA